MEMNPPRTYTPPVFSNISISTTFTAYNLRKITLQIDEHIHCISNRNKKSELDLDECCCKRKRSIQIYDLQIHKTNTAQIKNTILSSVINTIERAYVID
jgi:hypothetical protein